MYDAKEDEELEGVSCVKLINVPHIKRGTTPRLKGDANKEMREKEREERAFVVILSKSKFPKYAVTKR